MEKINKRFKIVWYVTHASLDCKQGVYSIDETSETEDGGFIFNETKYIQVIDFEELKSLSHFNTISNYLMSEFTPFNEHVEIDSCDIEEYLESVYDNEFVYFYNRRMITNNGTQYFVYYPVVEKLDDTQMDFAKCLGFTGEVYESNGRLEINKL